VDVRLADFLKETGAKPLSACDENGRLSRFCTDTRLIEKGDVFFAFSGSRFDGHDFIDAALEKGASYVVISDAGRVKPTSTKKACFLVVGDTVRAYGDLARFYRRQFKIPAVGITGSSGKTTVKELTAHLLSVKFKVLKNRGTENNLIGVPKTLFQLDASHQAMVLEMGSNQPGEIARLAEILSPQIGVLTQISASHLQGLKSLEGVRQEKLALLQKIERGGTLILNGEDVHLKEVRSGVHKIIRAGLSKENNQVWADQVWMHEQGTSFALNGEHRFETQLIGKHNVINALLAIQCALSFGVDIPALQRVMKEFKPVAGRLCQKNVAGVLFLDDTYNSNPGAFRAALETLKSFKTRGKKGVVCGDMLELGEESERWHREIGALMASMLFDFVIAAGPQSKFLVDELQKEGYHHSKCFHVKDSVEAGKACQQLVQTGDLVLVKGSRGMQMEKIFECFTNCSTP
jgi:UDP-N-acetylmuramoyl-tripeptide--D-alanyl-D-alanine ligase